MNSMTIPLTIRGCNGFDQSLAEDGPFLDLMQPGTYLERSHLFRVASSPGRQVG